MSSTKVVILANIEWDTAQLKANSKKLSDQYTFVYDSSSFDDEDEAVEAALSAATDETGFCIVDCTPYHFVEA